MSTTNTATQTGVDRAIDAALAENRLVGGVVMVNRGGERVYERAAGLADRERGVPFQTDTIVRYASVTKPFVSVAALRLIDRGEIGLDDPVTTWLPAFRPKLPDGTEPTILIRHLLTHTSGLGYRYAQPAGGPYDQADISDGLDLPGRSLDDNLARIAAQSLLAAPGTAFIYSVSTDVLGAILQIVTGQTLPDVVRTLVTEPLGIRDTGFEVTDVDRLATPYVNDTPVPHPLAENEMVSSPDWGDAAGVRFSPSRIFDPTSFPSGGAGMAGTAEGTMTLLEAIRRDAQDGEARLLARDTARALFTGQIGGLEVQPGVTFSFTGAVVADPTQAGTPQSVGTLSWGGVYGHSWFIDPERELVVLILTNTIYEGMSGQLPVDVRDALYGS